jgi:signal transduction histidine kinase
MDRLFDTTGFPARWHCGVWSAQLGWLTIISDLLVFSAYMAIPILLVYFIRRRRDVPFTGIFWLFCAFIAFCGVTHLIEALIFWWPAYRLSAGAKLATALVSWTTVLALIPVLPRALALPGLAVVNARLEDEMRARHAAQTEVSALNAELEHRVSQRTAELREAMLALESFTYTVAHDLRAPLRHLQGFASLLRERLDERSAPPEEAHFADRIAGAATRMGDLVDGLLAFSRAGQSEPRRDAVDMAALVAEVREDLRPAIGGRAVVWRVAALPPVRGDRALLREVWANLLSNAVKFSAGRVPAEIDVSAQRGPDPGEVTFVVRDNGVGFDMEHVGKLFGVFQRLHGNDEFEGTGIGLALVGRIVERHGGRVAAEGRSGAGAAFFVTLRADAA